MRAFGKGSGCGKTRKLGKRWEVASGKGNRNVRSSEVMGSLAPGEQGALKRLLEAGLPGQSWRRLS